VTDASHDHPLLSGMVSDVVHRSAAVHGIHFFYLEFLPGFAESIVPADVASGTFISSVSYGAGDRLNHHQHPCRVRSPDRQTVRVCAHSEISSGIEEGQSWSQQVS